MTDGCIQQPPYIADQEWRVLTEFEHPERYLTTAQFRTGRPGAALPADVPYDDPWVEVPDHEDVVLDRFNQDGISPGDLRRLVITTDAGVGKTKAVEWLTYQFNRPHTRCLAFNVPISELAGSAGSVDDRLLDYLAGQVRNAAREDRCSTADAERLVEFHRRTNRLVLLFDGLDQAGKGVAGLEHVLSSSYWSPCRFVLAGRPYALKSNWERLFANQVQDWRFLRLEEFDEDQQRRYLGKTSSGESQFDLIPEDARPILGVPRVLDYLRRLTDDDLAEVHTAADVYYQAIRELLKQGLAGSPQARLLGWETDTPPQQPHVDNLDHGFRLLSAIAFEMTSQSIRVQVNGEWQTKPNFDRIGRQNREFQRFTDRLRRDRYLVPPNHSFARDMTALAALNDILEHGVFDTDLAGLQEIQFRNRSLQEFLCAYYLANHWLDDTESESGSRRLEQDRTRLWEWVYLTERTDTEEFYYIWQFLCEMPQKAHDPQCWLEAIEPLYRPCSPNKDGDWEAKRSSEMIFRSWPRLEALCMRGKQRALEIRERWWGEFEQILAGQQGDERREAAKAFRDSFLTLPAGKYRMGSPLGKAGMPADKRRHWQEFIDEAPEGDPSGYVADYVADYLADWNFGFGKDVQRRKSNFQSFLLRVLSGGGIEMLSAGLYPSDETPDDPDQQIASFQLSRSPALNCWYRLYQPRHGLNGSPFESNYQKYSAGSDQPAIYLSWFNAWAFCWWARWEGQSCRLPWENEWEYAAKYGTLWDADYWWDGEFDPQKCNADWNIGKTTVPSSEHANPATRSLDRLDIGLMDLLGNVEEWCQDLYRGQYVQTISDAPGSSHGSRVLRGGSFSVSTSTCRSAYRDLNHPTVAIHDYGVRVARALPENLNS